MPCEDAAVVPHQTRARGLRAARDNLERWESAAGLDAAVPDFLVDEPLGTTRGEVLPIGQVPFLRFFSTFHFPSLRDTSDIATEVAEAAATGRTCNSQIKKPPVKDVASLPQAKLACSNKAAFSRFRRAAVGHFPSCRHLG
jgi:hypothetical protein